MNQDPTTSAAEAVSVLRSDTASPDEKTEAALYLHRTDNDDGEHEPLLLEALSPLIEREPSFQGGRTIYLGAVKLVAELACRRQRWKLAHNSLFILSTLGNEAPRWARNYRAKVFFRLQPKLALGRPDKVVELLEPLSDLDAQGRAVLQEYLALARTVFTLEGDDGTQYRSFQAGLKERVGPARMQSPVPTILIPPDEEVDEGEEVSVAWDAVAESTADLEEQLAKVLEEREQLRQRIEMLEAVTPANLEATSSEPSGEEADLQQILGKRHILVLGDVQVKSHHLRGIAKTKGLEKHHLEFETDYSKLPNFDLSTLQYSMNCAGILLGATPHSMKGMGDASSPLQRLSETEGYPPTVAMRSTSGELKGSKKAFRTALEDLLIQLTASTPSAGAPASLMA